MEMKSKLVIQIIKMLIYNDCEEGSMFPIIHNICILEIEYSQYNQIRILNNKTIKKHTQKIQPKSIFTEEIRPNDQCYFFFNLEWLND